MKDFTFWSPTKVVFGKDAETKVGELAKEFDANKALLHYGGESAKKSGLLDRVKNSLKAAKIEFIEIGGVKPNPRISLVREAAKVCAEHKVDFIIAVGGGSVLDSAKAIALAVGNNCDAWDFYSHKSLPEKALGVGCVPTLPAAGSEMSDSSVITNEDGNLKRGFSSALIHCKFAAMNPELTFTLSPFQTQCGCADIIMHTLERYFSTDNDRAVFDGFAESLLKNVMRAAVKVKSAPRNYEARSQIMLAAAMSHNDVTGWRNLGDWACHQLEHELSGMFDVAHGAGLTAIWPAWARYVYKANAPRFAQLAVNVFGVQNDFGSPEKTAQAGIEAFEEFFDRLGMPINISKLGITLTNSQIDELAYKCSFENTRTVGCVVKLDMQDMKNIYANA